MDDNRTVGVNAVVASPSVSAADSRAAHYKHYLAIQELLSLQRPLGGGREEAHDEMLFIVVHQAYELWFKQILYEIEDIPSFLASPFDDNGPDFNRMVHRLKRVFEVLRLLNEHLQVLETMTPLDFLDFRPRFKGASGFQSLQFRLIEARLGLRMEDRFGAAYYKHHSTGGFDEVDQELISKAEESLTVRKSLVSWLERAPYWQPQYWPKCSISASAIAVEPWIHPFWSNYLDCFRGSLDAESSDKQKSLLGRFMAVLFTKGSGSFSPQSLRSALFIMLYRDEPIFRLPFELLNSFLEIDEQISIFRYRHFEMVRRMIGLRPGTGGTSGAEYLKGAVEQNKIFDDLAALVTFQVERKNLPQLPKRLKRSLSFGGG